MINITFEINGRPVTSEDLGDAIDAMALIAVEENIRQKLDGIRDPKTGEFPVVAIRGNSIESLSVEVNGSPELIALVREKLASEEESDKNSEQVLDTMQKPKSTAFLCHASDDKQLAEQIARHLIENGIDTFYDTWSIGPGESVRRKIDEGLEDCTHFIALLTPQSIGKPWVQTEIDAAFMRKVDGKCRFIPLRFNLSADVLPPLLASLNSPELKNYDEDFRALMNSILGISKKPKLGEPPEHITQYSGGATGLTPGAEAVARLLIEKSEHGDTSDPQLKAETLKELTALPDDNLIDAVDELEGRGYVSKLKLLGNYPLGFACISAEAGLFANLDQHFNAWNPRDDARVVAAGLVNGTLESGVEEIGKKLGWPPRRLNPAINYLIERDLIDSIKTGCFPWCVPWIDKTPKTRRFVQGAV